MTRLLPLGLEPRTLPAGFLLTTEHADLNFLYQPVDGWTVTALNDDTQVHYASDPVPLPPTPPEAVLYAHPNSARIRPADPAFDFIGVGPSQPYYLLPQNQFGGVLYLGASSKGTTGVTTYNPAAESKGRVVNPGPWQRIQLVGVDGPGSFSAWANGSTGPIRYMSSFNDNTANPEADGIDYTDGISADDSFWLIQGSHLHYNWGFTAPGRYTLTFRGHALADHDADPGTPPVSVTSDDRAFTVSVDNVGRLTFSQANFSVSESAGLATITVNRTGGGDGSVSVDYETLLTGTATPGDDYAPTKGTLTFDDKQTTATFAVPIINDSLVESTETVTLRLTNFRPTDKDADPVGDPPLAGAIIESTLSILDDDGVPDPRPTVESVTVNAGSAQRSRVTRIDVRFSEIVTLTAGAAVVQRTPDNAIAGTVVTAAVENEKTVATIEFTGVNTESGSLTDGLWRLTIVAAGVTDSVNQTMPAEAVTDFHRLFGDSDGNRTVNFADFLAFRSSFGSPAFDPAFDADNNGAINFADFLQFRSRFGTSV